MIELRGLTKTYGSFGALRGVDLDIGAGEMVAVVGKSGSGKSTLLHLAGGIDDATSGTIHVDGTDIRQLSAKKLTLWRGRTIGFVFQFFQLLPTLTAVENVLLPMDFRGALPGRARRVRALELLERVGVAGHADQLPWSLSGGEQQRVAIARALANDPPVILADEPTGNLDSVTAAGVLELFRALAKDGRTVVIATHERDIDRLVDRTVTIADGMLAA